MGDFYYEVSLAEAGHDSFTITSCLLITKRHDKILILPTEIKKNRLYVLHLISVSRFIFLSSTFYKKNVIT